MWSPLTRARPPDRVTGHRNTIVMVTNQRVYDPIGVTNLAWTSDDNHLAVEVQYAAFART